MQSGPGNRVDAKNVFNKRRKQMLFQIVTAAAVLAGSPAFGQSVQIVNGVYAHVTRADTPDSNDQGTVSVDFDQRNASLVVMSGEEVVVEARDLPVKSVNATYCGDTVVFERDLSPVDGLRETLTIHDMSRAICEIVVDNLVTVTYEAFNPWTNQTITRHFVSKKGFNKRLNLEALKEPSRLEVIFERFELDRELGIDVGGNPRILVDLEKKEVTLTIIRAFRCPPGRVCAQVMPAPYTKTLSIVSVTRNLNGLRTIEAVWNSPIPGPFVNSATLTIRDSAEATQAEYSTQVAGKRTTRRSKARP
jgi:hypothetical protein